MYNSGITTYIEQEINLDKSSNCGNVGATMDGHNGITGI